MSDPCECFFDHESAMQRLLAMLRNSQADCTDTGCDTDGMGREGGNTMFMWTLLWTFMAMALYVMRPNSMRSDRRTDDSAIEKPTGSHGNDDNTPPPPPPSAM
uniref:Small integral membrane protein 14 n=1 Tax=Caenorhabditis tropicalis TaxID=1561998 RepID=A0A1I7UHU2_9PELO